VKSRLFWNLFKYVLAFGLLAWVIHQNWDPPAHGGEKPVGLKDVWEKHVVQGVPIHTGYFLLSVVIFTAAVLLTLVRWYILVRAQDLPFTLSGALRIGLVGFFFNSVLPGSVGGDIIKAAALAREQSRRTVAVATVLMDRGIALWGLIWFVALLGGAFWWLGLLDGPSIGPARNIILAAAAIVAFTCLVWIALGFLPQHRAERFAGRLSRLPKIGGSAAEFWRAVWMYRCRQWSVGLALVLSWVGHVGFVLAFYFGVRTLWDASPDNPIPTLAQHFVLVPIGMVIQAAPLFPGGAGISELGYGSLYTLFGSAAANGVLGSLVRLVITWGLGLIGYLVYLRMRARTRPVGEPTAAPPGEAKPALIEAS
jgi:uncharacterized protein (TIRG00374 family)